MTRTEDMRMAVADIDGLQRLAERVEHLAEGWPGEVGFAVQLCLEEAVSNALRHGGAPAVEVALWREAGRLWVEIVDAGVAFDPLAAAPPAAAESLATLTVGGRGIALMRKFCPDLSYRREGGFNRLRLGFVLPG